MVLFALAKVCKHLESSLTEDWIKMCCVHTVEYYSGIKKDEMLQFTEKVEGDYVKQRKPER